jgi:hypothetical protein
MVSGSPCDNARWLIGSIAGNLFDKHIHDAGVREVLERMAQQNISEAAFRQPEPRRVAACAHLPETTASAMLVAPDLAAALAAAEDQLRWLQNANYSDEALGPGFMRGYGYCEIVGPQGFFPGDDFLLGLMLLGPERIYRDHYHPAPELYWLLTGPTDWSHGHRPYEAYEAGDTLWHTPMTMHATRTLHAPLLAIWCWTSDTAVGARLA